MQEYSTPGSNMAATGAANSLGLFIIIVIASKTQGTTTSTPFSPNNSPGSSTTTSSPSELEPVTFDGSLSIQSESNGFLDIVLYDSGEWGRVSVPNDADMLPIAEVSCRSLGLWDNSGAVGYTTLNLFSQGHSFRSIQCYGHETSLLHCKHDAPKYTEVYTIFRVSCPRSSFVTQDVRLVGAPRNSMFGYQAMGLIQIYVFYSPYNDYTFQYTCETDKNFLNAACRHLGYDYGTLPASEGLVLPGSLTDMETSAYPFVDSSFTHSGDYSDSVWWADETPQDEGYCTQASMVQCHNGLFNEYKTLFIEDNVIRVSYTAPESTTEAYDVCYSITEYTNTLDILCKVYFGDQSYVESFEPKNDTSSSGTCYELVMDCPSASFDECYVYRSQLLVSAFNPTVHVYCYGMQTDPPPVEESSGSSAGIYVGIGVGLVVVIVIFFVVLKKCKQEGQCGGQGTVKQANKQAAPPAPPAKTNAGASGGGQSTSGAPASQSMAATNKGKGKGKNNTVHPSETPLTNLPTSTTQASITNQAFFHESMLQPVPPYLPPPPSYDSLFCVEPPRAATGGMGSQQWPPAPPFSDPAPTAGQAVRAQATAVHAANAWATTAQASTYTAPASSQVYQVPTSQTQTSAQYLANASQYQYDNNANQYQHQMLSTQYQNQMPANQYYQNQVPNTQYQMPYTQYPNQQFNAPYS